jgi:integrase
MRGIWIFARSRGIVANDFPGQGLLDRSDPQNQREFYFSLEQINLVLTDLRGNATTLKGRFGEQGSLDAWGQALISLHCGLRAGEIFELRWRDVDFGNRKGVLLNTKDNNKTRHFYFTDDVENMLKERFALTEYKEPMDYVFPSANGGKLREVGNIFQRCFKRLGINKLGEKDSKRKAVFHSFRHTFAILTVQETPVPTLQALLGHQQLKTTQRYASHSSETNERAAVERMNRKFQKKS